MGTERKGRKEKLGSNIFERKRDEKTKLEEQKKMKKKKKKGWKGEDSAIDHAGGSALLRKTSIKRSRADSATINSTYKSCPVTP